MDLAEASLEGDIVESNLVGGSDVAQERIRVVAVFVEPGAAQDEGVEPAVVVVVGLHEVQAGELVLGYELHHEWSTSTW